ncbi:MAG: prepilin peptidase [Chloroflexi bacterium]|uniref:A24 family peptidase n=1 Tax=Candidatus Chlorohelix allophototropha TaxID=3003348 RepID=A0A8T7M4M2_9CHLR|nr:prepilin peptidase [Chloroflexota bacterium]WJW70350.1 A24 family peptidase [Chloroflexota bacterium L227-S17]
MLKRLALNFILPIIFIGLLGVVAGRLIDRLSARTLSTSKKTGVPDHFSGWLFPFITAGVQVVGWLQTPYRVTPLYVYALNLILVWLLLLIAAIDLYTHQIFPKTLVLLGAVSLALPTIAVFLNPVVGVAKASDNTVWPVLAGNPAVKEPEFIQLWSLNLLDSLAGALVMLLLFGLFFIIGRAFFGREAVGGGDVVLATVVGLALGLKRTLAALPVIFLASLVVGLGLLVASRIQGRDTQVSRTLAFGPFICGGAIWVLLVV